MALLYLFLSSFALAFSGALVPGPLFTVTIDGSLPPRFLGGADSGCRARRPGISAAPGHGLGTGSSGDPARGERIHRSGWRASTWLDGLGILRDVKGMTIDFNQTGTAAGGWGLFAKGDPWSV